MKFPGVRQRDLSDCGVACLSAVAAWYGHHVPVARVRQWAATDKKGTTVQGIIEAARKIEMEAAGVRCEGGALQKVKLPAIAHVNVGSYLHFVVVTSVDDEQVWLMDPADGKCRKVSVGNFLSCWTGVLILLEPGQRFTTNHETRARDRLLRMAGPHRRSLIAAVLCALIYSLLGLAVSVYLKKVVDDVLRWHDVPLLHLLSLVAATLLIMQFAVALLKGRLVLKVSQKIDAGLILGYFRHLLYLPQRFHDSMRVGEVVSRINDAARINQFIHEVAVNMIVDVFVILSSLILMLIYNWRLALLMCLVVPVYALLFYVNDRTNKKWQRVIMQAGAEVEAQLVQSLHAVNTVRQLNLQEYCYKKVEQKFTHLMNTTRKLVQKQVVYHAGADFITRAFTLVVIWTGCLYVFKGTLSAGELVSFFAMASYFTTPALSLMAAGRSARDTLIAGERLYEVLDLEEEGKNENNKCLAPSHGAITFEGVSFRYGHGELVLRNLNLVIRKGTITGITGSSGSGKSTIISLLLKMYVPETGAILLDGTDLRDIAHHAVRNFFSAVPQNTRLFNETIRENITLDHKPADNELLQEVMIRSGLEEFCRMLPGGLDHVVVEEGANLSGGQKQKIALARALYRNAPVLVLDEPTASLDALSEAKIMQTVEWYRNRGNTVIIVSHSGNALKICDNIVLLKECTAEWQN